MNNRFKVLASYNLVQYVLHFKLLVVFVKVSKCPKSLNLTNIVFYQVYILVFVDLRVSLDI
jgi:hypothetical protein